MHIAGCEDRCRAVCARQKLQSCLSPSLAIPFGSEYEFWLKRQTRLAQGTMQSNESIIGSIKAEVTLNYAINKADAAMTTLNQTFYRLVSAFYVVDHQGGEQWMIGIYQHNGHTSVLETCSSSVVGKYRDHQQTIYLALFGQLAKVGVTLIIALHIVQH